MVPGSFFHAGMTHLEIEDENKRFNTDVLSNSYVSTQIDILN